VRQQNWAGLAWDEANWNLMYRQDLQALIFMGERKGKVRLWPILYCFGCLNQKTSLADQLPTRLMG